MERRPEKNFWRPSVESHPASANASALDPKLQGIRGWLLIIAIQLVLWLLVAGFFAALGLTLAFDVTDWTPARIVLLGVSTSYFIWMTCVVVVFFRKRRYAPRLVVSTYWIAAVLSVLDLQFSAVSLGAFLMALVGQAYFDKSIRVQQTFVH